MKHQTESTETKKPEDHTKHAIKKTKNVVTTMPHRPFIILISVAVVGIVTFIALISINAKGDVIDDTGKGANIVAQSEFESLSYNLLIKRKSWEGADGNYTESRTDRQSTGYYTTAINEEKHEKYIVYYDDYWPEQNKQGKKDTIQVSKRKVDEKEIESAKNIYQEPGYKNLKELVDELTEGGYEYITK